MKRILFNFVFIIFAIFLGVMIFRSLLLVDEPLTFSMFFTYLEKWDSFLDIDNIFGRSLIPSISGDWGIVDFLRELINTFFIEAINLVLWFAGALIQALFFILKVITFLISY